jgi:sigma-B regulation protein RsbU (phosphoserine phosphatase)
VNLSFLSQLWRQQYVNFVLASVLVAIFWAVGQHVNPLLVLVYTLCLGNLLALTVNRLQSLYLNKPFPFNWLIFLSLLMPLTVPFYLLSTAAIWLFVRPRTQSLTELLAGGWKLAFLVTLVFGSATFFYRTSRRKLERRNLELQHSVDQGNAQLQSQNQELQRAREIQQSLLPREIPQIPSFAVAGAWQPASSVSGDYYDVLRLGDRRLGICIADVVGKGVSAALLMANVQAAVRALAVDSDSPAGVCTRVNRLLHENIAAGKFVTFFYGILDGDKRTFQYCNAGHNCPILVSANSASVLDKAGGMVLGIFPDARYEESTIELQRGDRLLLFTDGITEAANASGQEFEDARIAAFAEANMSLSANDLTSQLMAKVAVFCDAHFHDDATLLVIAAN